MFFHHHVTGCESTVESTDSLSQSYITLCWCWFPSHVPPPKCSGGALPLPVSRRRIRSPGRPPLPESHLHPHPLLPQQSLLPRLHPPSPSPPNLPPLPSWLCGSSRFPAPSLPQRPPSHCPWPPQDCSATAPELESLQCPQSHWCREKWGHHCFWLFQAEGGGGGAPGRCRGVWEGQEGVWICWGWGFVEVGSWE